MKWPRLLSIKISVDINLFMAHFEADWENGSISLRPLTYLSNLDVMVS